MRAADIIGKKLAEAGCLNSFGIPGGEVPVSYTHLTLPTILLV